LMILFAEAKKFKKQNPDQRTGFLVLDSAILNTNH
jgi:hypothetical protein